jgi:hypothetical protein
VTVRGAIPGVGPAIVIALIGSLWDSRRPAPAGCPELASHRHKRSSGGAASSYGERQGFSIRADVPVIPHESDRSDTEPGGVVMPRFFFNVRGPCRSLSRDELGLDFPDVETAYLEAFHAAQDLGGEFAARGQNPRDYAIEIVNVSNELVFDLPFLEVLDRRAGQPPLPRSEVDRTARGHGNGTVQP